MEHNIAIIGNSKSERQQAFLEQWQALLQGETDEIALLANTAAAIQSHFTYHWLGFYRVMGKWLVLGPFQGPVACTRIAFGKGVCGRAWQEKRIINVPDVDAFPGHIACSALSRSELVVPILDPTGNVHLVLDIDSTQEAAFDSEDERFFAQIAQYLSQCLFTKP